MAWSDVYYKVVGDDIYYTNEEKSGYTMRQGGEICTEGKHVIIELYNGKFKFPNGSAWLFYGAINTTFNDMDKWETVDAWTFTGIFENCTALLGNDLDFSSFTIGTDNSSMNSMFKNCSSLTELDLSALLPDNKITNFDSMFEGCTSLQRLNLMFWWNRYSEGAEPSYNRMFYNCYNLENIGVRTDTNWNYNWGHPMPCENMFYNCVKLPHYNPESIYDLTYAYASGETFGYTGYFTPIPYWYLCDVYIKEDNTWKLMEAYQ